MGAHLRSGSINVHLYVAQPGRRHYQGDELSVVRPSWQLTLHVEASLEKAHLNGGRKPVYDLCELKHCISENVGGQDNFGAPSTKCGTTRVDPTLGIGRSGPPR